MRQSWRSGRRPESRPAGCPSESWRRRPLHRDGGRPAASENHRRTRTRFLSAGRRASRPTASRRTPAWMRVVSISLLAPLSGSGVQDEFLEAPLNDFTDQNLIFNAAIDSVYRAELSLLFAGDTEFAEHGAVQLHFEDLSGDLVDLRVVRVRVGIGGVEILMPRSRGDAQGPRRADVVEGGLVVQVVVEHHDALVAAAAPVDIALGVHGDGMQQRELAGPRSATADLFDELPVFVVLGDA